MTIYPITPVGVVKSQRIEPTDDFWGDLISEIHLDKDQFTQEALFGLADFSHAEILFLMHKVPSSEIEKGARHPRGRKDWPLVGIFGPRRKGRPNRIGLSRCTIQKIEGTVLTVRALDAIDGPRHQALHARIRPDWHRPPARLVERAHARLLQRRSDKVTPRRTPAKKRL